MTAFGVIDILKVYGFDPVKTEAKLARHKDTRNPLEALERGGWLELYQGYQSEPCFDGANIVVSFVGLEGRRARASEERAPPWVRIHK